MIHLLAFFSADIVRRLTAEVDRLTAEDPKAGHHKVWLGPWLDEAKYRRQPPTLMSIHHVHIKSPYWREIMASPSIRALMSDLLSVPNVELCRATIITKPPETGAQFPLHQDGAYVDLPPQYVQAMVYLDDMTEDNGPIRFLAGSHRQGLLPHCADGKKHLPLDAYPVERAMPLMAKAGDFVCFSPWLVHGSMPNHSAQIRRTVRLGYASAGSHELRALDQR